MERAQQRTKSRLTYQVRKRGERPKQQLLEAFRELPSVLFAAHSFWEGVDVPGDALSLLIIDRLPFASPGDPLVAARIKQISARGEEAFEQYQLPQATLALRQGFGRLIRTQSDRGAVALLDRRIVTKPYGRAFLESLPKAQRVEALDALRQASFLERNRTVRVAGRQFHTKREFYDYRSVQFGDMFSNLTASYDPIFWPIHANIDRLWWDWQQLNPNAVPADQSSVLTPWGYTTADTLDISRFGYEYVRCAFTIPVGLEAPVGRFTSAPVEVPEGARQAGPLAPRIGSLGGSATFSTNGWPVL
jgi:hypothetical protein